MLLTRARHRHHLQRCSDALERFRAADGEGLELVLSAEELRVAVAELGYITGRVDVEELLDVVFRDFCIGK